LLERVILQLATMHDKPEADATTTNGPPGVRAIRPRASEASRQGLPYFHGISAETVGARGLAMHLVAIPPGASSEPHRHLGYETGSYVLEGRVLTRWGERLENETVSEVGEFLFIGPGVPHQSVNLGATDAARAVVARNDPAEGDKVELLALP
jgi:uncharacterized RmlC-like cupin family protein